jgi:RimJ/RimL family protein N-acetyltransferase
MPPFALVPVPPPTLRDLHRDGTGHLEVPDVNLRWPDADRRTLGYRIAALDRHPDAWQYLLHVAVGADGVLIGRIGCHEGPDEAGEVEIGYFVAESRRGAGWGGRIVDAFLEWLRRHPVQRVRASVRPDNLPSLRLLERRGFVQTGTQIDDEDGLELVLSRALAPPTTPHSRR